MRIADRMHSLVSGKSGQQPPQDKGLLLLQIDGLSLHDMQIARQEGLMPNLDRLVKEGKLNLGSYYCSQPSQTVVSQAGVLMGQSVPANQWFEKENGFAYKNTMGLANPDEVQDELAARGDGGILQGGRTYMSPLAAGASPKETFFAVATLTAAQREGGKSGLIKEALREFSHVMFFWGAHPVQAGRSLKNYAHQVRDGFQTDQQRFPEKGTSGNLKDALHRNFVSGILDDACTQSMLHDMKNGVPVMYKDYEGYDDRNHQEGIPEFSRRILPNVDRDIARLIEASTQSPRQYNVVIYADHGCCPGEFFKDRNGGQTFDQFLTSCLPPSIPKSVDGPDGKPMPPFLTQDIGSGVNIYFTSTTKQMDRKQIEAQYPGVIDRLKHQKDMACVITRDGSDTVIENPEGTMRVTADGQISVEGKNPLEQFGEDTVMGRELADMMHRQHQGDITVVGKELPGNQAVNFGVLPGLHGGIGGHQQAPMIAFAPDVPLDPKAIGNSVDLYHQLTPLLPSDSGLAQKLAAKGKAAA